MSTQSQSTRIRNLAYKGYTNGQIAKRLGKRYQTIWRTLHRPYKGIVPQTDLILKGIRKVEEPILNQE